MERKAVIPHSPSEGKRRKRSPAPARNIIERPNIELSCAAAGTAPTVIPGVPDPERHWFRRQLQRFVRRFSAG